MVLGVFIGIAGTMVVLILLEALMRLVRPVNRDDGTEYIIANHIVEHRGIKTEYKEPYINRNLTEKEIDQAARNNMAIEARVWVLNHANRFPVSQRLAKEIRDESNRNKQQVADEVVGRQNGAGA